MVGNYGADREDGGDSEGFVFKGASDVVKETKDTANDTIAQMCYIEEDLKEGRYVQAMWRVTTQKHMLLNFVSRLLGGR